MDRKQLISEIADALDLDKDDVIIRAAKTNGDIILKITGIDLDDADEDEDDTVIDKDDEDEDDEEVPESEDDLDPLPEE